MEPHESQKVITPKLKDLLDKISRKAQEDNWCPVEDLTNFKTISVMTALDRSLKELELMGRIERRLDNRSKEYVRMNTFPASEKSYDLYGLDVS